MPKIIKAGIRPSPLALRQAEEIQRFFPECRLETIPIQTRGDQDKTLSLFDQVDSDFFTDAIERALLDGSIDIGIHSAKDLEKDMPQGLTIVFLTPSISPFECLVCRQGMTLDRLPVASRIATSSRKRKDAIQRLRPDLIVEGIRGNIDERLAQVDNGKFDALIVAHAAMLRLGYEARIAQIIPRQIMEPHPLQGSLALQIRKDRDDLKQIFGCSHEK